MPRSYLSVKLSAVFRTRDHLTYILAPDSPLIQQVLYVSRYQQCDVDVGNHLNQAPSFNAEFTVCSLYT